MTQTWAWTRVAAASFAAAATLMTISAQAQAMRGAAGGPGMSAGAMRGGGGAGMRGGMAGGGMRSGMAPGMRGGMSPGMMGGQRAGMMQMRQGGMQMRQGGPRYGSAGIDARVRTGYATRGAYVRGGGYGGAAPLTITRNRTYANNVYRAGGYDGRRYGTRRYYNNRGFIPGLLAAPFVVAGGLFGGGGYGYGYDEGYGYGYGYDQGYYPYGQGYQPAYSGPVGYPASASYAYGQVGNYCATPQKTCQLYTPAEVGVGCSCRAPAGLPRFRGQVVP